MFFFFVFFKPDAFSTFHHLLVSPTKRNIDVCDFHHICNIKCRLHCRHSPKNIFNAKNFNPHKKPIFLLNVPICTQGMQLTWWPEAGTNFVTGPYSGKLPRPQDPSTLPCGMPLVTTVGWDLAWLIWPSYVFFLLKKSDMRPRIFSSMFYKLHSKELYYATCIP